MTHRVYKHRKDNMIDQLINSYPDPLVARCVLGLLGLFLACLVLGGIGSLARDERERQRTEAYSVLIAADNALLDGDITQKEYTRIHDAFYAEFPGGDVSL